MDFQDVQGDPQLREQARAWVESHVSTSWADVERATGTHHTPQLHQRLIDEGILGAGWPAEFGGSDVDPVFARAVFDELVRHGLATGAWGSTGMVCRTILEVGTEEQKQTYVAAALRGEVLIALGYTEPESGSDVASARTKAVREGDSWVVNGQKMFTSTVEACTHVFLLTRTNPEVPKHRGLTLFLVPTDDPGFDLRPIHTLGGQRTNATFYTDVRVDDRARVGDVDGGWGVMHVALVYERGAASRSSKELALAGDLASWATRTRRSDGSRVIDDPHVAERLARMSVDEEVARLITYSLRDKVERGELPRAISSMRKLFATNAAQRHYADAMDILGADGLLGHGVPDSPDGGRYEHGFRAEVVTTIHGGSSEVQREIIAEQQLGLPRARPRR
jgi:alkylation response protein AidB-like acyl-CoA dehydrogenase